MKRILILGGDGYLGWPTAMYFSNHGYDVTVIDNYFRRNACTELDVGMLYPVPNLIERAKIWHEITGKEIKVVIGDLADAELMRSLFKGTVEYNWALDTTFTGPPDTVVHYAEQPSAPYSMINYKYANITLSNNLMVTNNLMFAVRDYSKDTHIIKLGTMGEYGTPNIDIEEGWIEIEHKGKKDKFLFPRQAGSLYHTSKIMDTDLLWFGVRMWDLKITDLAFDALHVGHGVKIDIQMATGFHQLGRDDAHGAIVGGKGLVQLRHHAADGRILFRQDDPIAGVGQVK